MLEHIRSSLSVLAPPAAIVGLSRCCLGITAEQIRMTRGSLRLGAAELGRTAGVATTTISRCEAA
jgi:hypothetical protein